MSENSIEYFKLKENILIDRDLIGYRVGASPYYKSIVSSLVKKGAIGIYIKGLRFDKKKICFRFR